MEIYFKSFSLGGEVDDIERESRILVESVSGFKSQVCFVA